LLIQISLINRTRRSNIYAKLVDMMNLTIKL